MSKFFSQILSLVLNFNEQSRLQISRQFNKIPNSAVFQKIFLKSFLYFSGFLASSEVLFLFSFLMSRFIFARFRTSSFIICEMRYNQLTIYRCIQRYISKIYLKKRTFVFKIHDLVLRVRNDRGGTGFPSRGANFTIFIRKLESLDQSKCLIDIPTKTI